MIEWWSALSLSMKILWGITLASSLIFVIQSILTFIGIGGDGDFDFDADIDADVPGDGGMGLLTFRNFVNFFLGFGWAAILLHDSVSSTALLLSISVVIGIILVIAVMSLFKWLYSMQQSGNIDVFKCAVDCKGQVYIPIPATRSGEGKVQITINGTTREYNAVTDGEALPTGREIRVVEVVSQSTLLVEEINSVII